MLLENKITVTIINNYAVGENAKFSLKTIYHTILRYIFIIIFKLNELLLFKGMRSHIKSYSYFD